MNKWIALNREEVEKEVECSECGSNLIRLRISSKPIFCAACKAKVLRLRPKKSRKTGPLNKTCEKCGKPHDGFYASGRFCSKSCAASRPKTQDNKDKVSASLLKYHEENPKHPKYVAKVCPTCKMNFNRPWKRRHRIFCSPKCASGNPKVKAKIVNAIRERIAKGLHKGWAARDKTRTSYPELRVITFLNKHNIQYVKEKKVDKYFIDFALEDRKIALEIDGQQHNMKERVEHDRVKDECLKRNGWDVRRIKVPNLNNKDRAFEFFNQIAKVVGVVND
jgi:very-short-patch-repair endonuclease